MSVGWLPNVTPSTFTILAFCLPRSNLACISSWFFNALDCVCRRTCCFARCGFSEFPRLCSAPLFLLSHVFGFCFSYKQINELVGPSVDVSGQVFFAEVQTSAAAVWNLHVESGQLLEQLTPGCV